MYACVHAPDAAASGTMDAALHALASMFSPLVERTAPGTVIFSVAGLRRLMGGPKRIAAEIARRGEQMHIRAQMAIAPTPDAALLAAWNLPGVTLIDPGCEASSLAAIGVEALARAGAQAETLATLHHWGVRTLGDLAALPGLGLIERFGEEGEWLRRMALGAGSRPLRVEKDEEEAAAGTELEHPLDLLEPLLFVLNTLIREAMHKLASRGLAANQITIELNGRRRALEFPVPVSDPAALLKQVQLDLEAHPAGEEVSRVRVELRPAVRRVRQSGLFTPPAPEAEKLQTLLARIGALVGPENVGSPELLDTHRPDAWRLRPFTADTAAAPEREPPAVCRLSLRIFRPALPARVRVEQARPVRIEAARVRGAVLAAAGPWRRSGDWWGDLSWVREEWDVGVSDGGLYRIYCARADWFVDGVYD